MKKLNIHNAIRNRCSAFSLHIKHETRDNFTTNLCQTTHSRKKKCEETNTDDGKRVDICKRISFFFSALTDFLEMEERFVPTFTEKLNKKLEKKKRKNTFTFDVRVPLVSEQSCVSH